MRFNDYECCAVEMGDFLLDGGAMFGVVPKTLWSRKIPSDGQNRIPMKARALLIRGNGKNILVDTGCGSKFPPKMRQIYGIEEAPETMDTPLEPFGLKAAEITHVILTHLHFDHAGGATSISGETLVPSFPNAVYYTTREQWEMACAPSILDKASFLEENFMPLKEKGQLEILENGELPIEGIEMIRSNGHTRGQQHPLIKGEESALFYCGDLIPTAAHLSLPWHMGYDKYPLTIIEEKSEILGRAVAENFTLFFEHDPVCEAATVKMGKKGVEIDRQITL